MSLLDGQESGGTDVLIRARWGAYEVGFDELARDVEEAVEALWSLES